MMLARPLAVGVLAFFLMLAVFFGVVGLVSGINFTADQFRQFWYFLTALAAGFGIQAGLYTYLRRLAARHGTSSKVVAATGTTSAASMISCCAHYLVNILPVMGITGFLTLVAEYQIELFWVGLAFNAAGIIYITYKVIQASKEQQKC